MQKREQMTLDQVMAELDRWVSQRGSGRYIPGEFVATVDADYGLPEDFGIQQVRAEIKDFAEVLLRQPRHGWALEIGLGYFGSTHILWRMLYDRVSTIEYQRDRVFQFRENARSFLGKHVLDDGRSSFFFGSSHSPQVLRAVWNLAEEGVDMLFIDGDHSFEGVLEDWLLYAPLVRPGGIVAFHDAVADISQAGVPRLMEKLAQGRICGFKPELHKIVHSRNLGIAYYIK